MFSSGVTQPFSMASTSRECYSAGMKVRIVSLKCLLAPSIWISLAWAQQSTPPATISQEFFDAIKNGNSAGVTELLEQHPALIKASTKNGTTPVLYAVYAKRPQIAELLIARGVALNIFEAAATDRIERVRELLRNDPSLSHAFSQDGWTALHLNFNNLAMARLLIDAGSDLNANSRNKLNATPLQGAAANNWVELAKLYLSKGASVNCRNEDGGTPLHEAAGNGFLDFAKLLVERGANVNVKDDNGKTPLSTALQYKRPDLADFLRNHGGLE
jgi:ankyrin repeat protein